MLQDFIERMAAVPSDHFDMSRRAGYVPGYVPGSDTMGACGEVLSRCGTAGCLAGWFCAFFRPETPVAEACEVAGAMLGLTGPQRLELFWATNRDHELYPRLQDVPLSLAVEALKSLATTGEVRWN